MVQYLVLLMLQKLCYRASIYMSGTYESLNTEYAELAVKYADEVIKSGDCSLLPRAEFMKYNRMTPVSNKETIFAIKRVASEFSGNDHYYGVGGMYGVIGGMGWSEMYASAKYIDLLDETGRNDWYNNKLVDAPAVFIKPQYVEEEVSVFRFIKNVYPFRKVNPLMIIPTIITCKLKLSTKMVSCIVLKHKHNMSTKEMK